MMADVLTAEEAAGELRMSAEGIRRLIGDGRLRAVKVGKQWLIDRAEIGRILSEGTAPITLAGGRTLERTQLAKHNVTPIGNPGR